MDAHLVNPENGLYFLNIDAEGNPHTDVTGDEVFPVMFRACDEETGFRIIRRLNSPDFWTGAGIRTVSREDAQYDPSSHVGLLGGVWPGLTWWYAFAAARYHPEFMVRSLRASFEHYAANPRANNTVPGQFSEWFDGESLVNRGMRLSPWEPPRFLWAAVEGVLGLMLSTGLPHINPLIPPDWKWVALRRLLYHGRELSYFVVRLADGFQVYADCEIETEGQARVYDEDVSSGVAMFSAAAAVVAFAKGSALAILIGSVSSRTEMVQIDISALVDASKTYRMRIYDSERHEWTHRREGRGQEVECIARTIEARGFQLIELTPV
jgi:hypothetical protein